MILEELTVAVGDQQLNEAEKELLSTAYRRLEIWRNGCQKYHEAAKEARAVYRLADPWQDLPNTPAEQKTLQLQTLKSTVNNCIADQMDNMPEATMAPERPGLEETATDLTDVVRFILDQNDYEAIHRRRVEDFFVTGSSVTQVCWDEDMDGGKGDVALIRWPLEAFLWDPFAETIQSARALMKVSWHPLGWFRDHYPEAGKYVTGEDQSRHAVGQHDAQLEAGNDDEAQAMLVEYWYRTYDAKKNRYSINVAYMAGGALLDSFEDVYDHGMYPFIVDAMTPIEGLPVGEGLVMELAPMMRYVNRYAHYIDENLRMSSKNRALVRRNANLDVNALRNWQENIIQGDDISPDAVQWFQSKPLSGMAPQQMLQFQSDIKQDSGQNQFTRGETAGGVTAASAISALQEAGGKITRLRTAVLNQGFKDMVEQVMWLVSQFYGDKKARMITGRDGKPREVDMSAKHLMGDGKASKGKLPAPPYHVQIQISRRNPLRVQAQNELFIQAYTMAAQAGQQFPLSMLFELLQVDGKDRIMPVLQSLDQTQALMQQLTQENEMLKGQMQSLQQVISDQGQAIRHGMYAQASATDQPLPEVDMNS
jgi:hypothetical protein